MYAGQFQWTKIERGGYLGSRWVVGTNLGLLPIPELSRFPCFSVVERVAAARGCQSISQWQKIQMCTVPYLTLSVRYSIGM